jgi:hypothetical protein
MQRIIDNVAHGRWRGSCWHLYCMMAEWGVHAVTYRRLRDDRRLRDRRARSQERVHRLAVFSALRFRGVFAALLGNSDKGRWSIAPAEEVLATRRRYRERTLILETEYQTANGAVTLTDWMPPRTGRNASNVIRIVEGNRGEVRMRMEVIIRFECGSIFQWVRRIEGGFRATAGPESLRFRADVDLLSENFRTCADFKVSEGQRIPGRTSAGKCGNDREIGRAHV